jgi:hypothetical protein
VQFSQYLQLQEFLPASSTANASFAAWLKSVWFLIFYFKFILISNQVTLR